MNKWEPMKRVYAYNHEVPKWICTYIGEDYYFKVKEACKRIGEKDYKKKGKTLYYGTGKNIGTKGEEEYIYMDIEGIKPQLSMTKSGYFNILYNEENEQTSDLILAKFKQLVEEEGKLEVTELKCEV